MQDNVIKIPAAAEPLTEHDILHDVNRDSMPYVFWEEIVKGKNKTLKLSHKLLYDYIQDQGYRKILIKTIDKVVKELCQIKEHIVKVVEISDIIADITNYINTLPDQISDNFTKEDLQDLWIRGIDSYVTLNKMNYIPFIEPEFIRDRKDEMYLFFKNGFLTINKDSAKLKPYSKLHGYIWHSDIIDIVYKSGSNDSVFKRFCQNICTDKKENSLYEDRYVALRSVIGYLLHDFKNSANLRAIILTENTLTPDSNGGTGKGLLVRALSHLRKTAIIDGKNMQLNSQFAFQQINVDTKILLIDDITKRFPFERLFSAITEGISFERKGKDRIHLKAEDSPKIVLSTNYTLSDSDSGSAKRRKYEFELCSYYGSDYTPEMDFSQTFFSDDWQPDDWLKFYNYIVDCCQYYMQNDCKLLPYSSFTLEQKKLMMDTSIEFVEFCFDFFDRKERNFYIPVKDFKDQFLDYVDNADDYKGKNIGTMLSKFCKSKNINIERKSKRIHGYKKSVKCYYFNV